MHPQVSELRGLIEASGRDQPIPKLPERKLKALEREAARAAAIAEQEREAEALAEVGVHVPPAAPIAAAAVGDGLPAGCSNGQQQQQQVSKQQVSTPELGAAAAAGAAVQLGSVQQCSSNVDVEAPAAKRQAVGLGS